ncbi:GGDEF domain-containing protein [Modestobacter sp. NPDC049651]|uniref:GGDEF domain-containing protein n=1 Tax=unclassified Modestobacter TaxID=2643866 RepID=UPI00340F9409
MPALLHRPADLVARVRWLFFLCGVGSLVLTTVAVLPGAGSWSLLLLGTSVAALCASWLQRYRTQHARLLFDVTDVLAVLLFAAGCPRPVLAFGIAFPALWYRAVYGRRREVAAYVVAMCLALAAALHVWPLVPGHDASIAAAAVLGNVPTLLLTAVVVRHLVASLFERERDQQRDAALAALSGQLLGVTDRRQIMQAAWRTAEAICDATPGLRAAVLNEDGDELRVTGTAGHLLAPLTTLPRTLLPADGIDTEPVEVAAPTALVRSAGFSSQWLLMALPDQPGAAMLLGAPGSVPREGIVAARSMLNQVALAVRTSSAHQELRSQALTDGLTGLANRAAFSAAMAAALHSPESESWVLFLDLDDFKVVNDTLGHLAGDRLLAHLGTALTGALRHTDLCARLGGDEFAVLLPGTSEADARALGQRLVELISTPVRLAEGTARIGASIGAARVRPGSTETDVVHEADLAMYAAKASGKNRVQFFSAGLVAPDTPAGSQPARPLDPAVG